MTERSSIQPWLRSDRGQHAIYQWLDVCTLRLLLLERRDERFGLLRRCEHQKSLFAIAASCQSAAPCIPLSWFG